MIFYQEKKLIYEAENTIFIFPFSDSSQLILLIHYMGVVLVFIPTTELAKRDALMDCIQWDVCQKFQHAVILMTCWIVDDVVVVAG